MYVDLTVVLPDMDRNQQSVKELAISDSLREISSLFGGSTITSVTGLWAPTGQEMLREDGRQLRACGELSNQHVLDLVGLLHKIGKRLNQSALWFDLRMVGVLEIQHDDTRTTVSPGGSDGSAV